MLNNSFQSIHDVLLYRVEHDKKSLTVNLLYEFARTTDEKFSKNFIAAVIKKVTTIIIKLQKELKERAHRQDQTTEKLTTLQTLHQCQRYDCVNFTRYC
jgi:HD superfamily phosphodiesterase